MRQLDEHTKELTRKQSDAAAQESVQELEAAKKAIQVIIAMLKILNTGLLILTVTFVCSARICSRKSDR